MSSAIIKDSDGVQNYQFKEINYKNKASSNNKQLGKDEKARKYDSIKKEWKNASSKGFTISPIVSKQRGIDDVKTTEFNELVKKAVELECNKVKEQAYKEGYEEGLRAGKEDIKNKIIGSVDEQLKRIESMVDDIIKIKDDIIKQQKLLIIKTIKNLVKWIILKEVKDDNNYIERLFNKLVLEIGRKDNFLVKVNGDNLNELSHIVDIFKEKIGNIKNIRIEQDYLMKGCGIILESETEIIDGSIDKQFEKIDEIFKHSGIKENDTKDVINIGEINEDNNLNDKNK